METKKWVYCFDELDGAKDHVSGDWYAVRRLFGGKGANLADMARIGVPVPYGFVVTTEACIAYLESGSNFPEGMWGQVEAAIKKLEAETGKRLGSENDPLLASCRSGASFSMPGMMDTVLHIGLNSRTVPAMIRLTNNARIVYNAYRCLIQMFGTVILGIDNELFEAAIADTLQATGACKAAELSEYDWERVVENFKDIYRLCTANDFPEAPYKQLKMAIEALIKLWNGERAANPNADGFTQKMGASTIIVTLESGNIGPDCATGVATTLNSSNEERHLDGNPINATDAQSINGSVMLDFFVAPDCCAQELGGSNTHDCKSVDPRTTASLFREILKECPSKDLKMEVDRHTIKLSASSPSMGSQISGLIMRLLKKLSGAEA
jgi:pyruvate,orthophosphate dikinase